MSLSARLIKKIDQTDASLLEGAVRSVLINLSFRFSNEVFEWTTDQRLVIVVAPTRFVGRGKVRIGKDVVFGVINSFGNLMETRIEVRHTDSVIAFGDKTTIGNMSSIVSDGSTINFGERCLAGPELRVMDSNFHMLPVTQRTRRDDKPQPVNIGNDVLMGSRVTILKGVTVGDGCVIAAGAVLFPGFTAPANSIVAGNPATVVGTVPAEQPSEQ